MATRTVLHVGLPKTGTTYLQTAMWRHRRELRRRGFLFPGEDRMDHFQLARSVGGVPGPEGLSDRKRAELVAAVRDWSGTALLSHEFLSQATEEQAAGLVEELGETELVVVVTARDYLRQLPAVWQEALKMGSRASLSDFVEMMLAPGYRERVREAHRSADVARTPARRAWGWSTQDLAAVVERWAGAVGTDRLVLVTVPQSGAPRSLLWDRWREVSGIDDTGLDLTAARANESLGAAQARVLSEVTQHLGDDYGTAPMRHRWLRGYLGHEVLVPQGGDRIGLSEQHVERVAPVAEAMLEEVSRSGVAVVGDLEELRCSSQPATHRDPGTVSDAEALEVAATAMQQMVLDVRRWQETAQRPTPTSGPVAVRSAVRRVARGVARRLRDRYDARAARSRTRGEA